MLPFAYPLLIASSYGAFTFTIRTSAAGLLWGEYWVKGVPRSTTTVLYTESSVSRCLDDFVVRHPFFWGGGWVVGKG